MLKYFHDNIVEKIKNNCVPIKNSSLNSKVKKLKKIKK